MRRIMIVALAALALAGCKEDEQSAAAPAEPAATEQGSCDASEMQDLVGKTFSSDYLPAGTSAVRVIHPDTAVTMDFRPDRLNIKLDENEKIIEISCG